MEEIWKDIEWYDGIYKVSNNGRIASLKYWWKILKPWLIGKKWKQYLGRVMTKDNIVKNTLIHRLVALAFIPNPDNKPQVNHKNWMRDDNRVENLEWCTSKENNAHSRNVLLKGRKPIKRWQYDLEWNFIREWDSLKQVQRETGYREHYIRRCIQWKQNAAYKYLWKNILDTK